MKASETNLQAIIEGTKQYIIPMFQRTYSWKEKQWKQLWEDLITLLEEDDTSTHFMGSIVSIPIETSTHGVQKFLVIDGQQRLTTLLLLLVAIRDNVDENNEDQRNLAGEIQQTLLKNPYKSGEDVYKLLPTQVDKETFKRIINKEKIDETNDSLISKSYHFFLNIIPKSGIDLRILKNKITSNLSIVSIILSHEDNPYLVFESLNAKGQPLTQADLIRNFLFMRIPSDDQKDQYKRYWLPMQDKLAENLTEFIRHFLLGINLNVKKSDVYIKFREKVGNQDVKEFLKRLSYFGENYAKLINPKLEEHKEICSHLKSLNEFEAKTTYPFLLYVYHDYINEKYNAQQFCQILNTVENFLVRRFVCNIDSKPLNKLFAALYNQLSSYDAETSIRELEAYLQNRGYPKNKEVSLALKENPLYGQGDRRKRAAFILRAIEASYNHKEKVNLMDTTIEHIMPQTLTSHWQEELEGDAETIHDFYLHTIGNLTLSGYNTELSNEPFSVKQKYYANSNIQLTKQICKYKQWNRESIESRTNTITTMFFEVWPYFGSPENEINEITGTSPRLLILNNDSFYVKTWREVMKETVMYIYEKDKNLYHQMVDKNLRHLSLHSEDMRKPIKLPNGHYMEGNLGARTIFNYCQRLFVEAGFDKNNWKVEVQVK